MPLQYADLIFGLLELSLELLDDLVLLSFDLFKLCLNLLYPFIFLAEFVFKLHLVCIYLLVHQLALFVHLLHNPLVQMRFFLKQVLFECPKLANLIQELLVLGAQLDAIVVELRVLEAEHLQFILHK